ncbi:hypothetical protein C7H85_04870 [Zobellella endophytica]|uniref:Uncharacterized protein n=1 Tax=Zobellella endophytica TaxID=2116700 RepID=A0A2P7RD44_9GAMM|nr:hypothetical protein [Zobellella endophytica]PSJ48119.1 hypothetical protein C7H85_04870 [Zobellella endophytica]
MNEHEALRKALSWLLQQPGIDRDRIGEASRHFDLSPLDEEFLVQYFLHRGHDIDTVPPKKPPD